MWSVQLHVTCRDAGDATQSHGQVASLRTRVVWYWSEEARVGPVTRLCDPMADSAGVCVSFVGVELVHLAMAFDFMLLLDLCQARGVRCTGTQFLAPVVTPDG